MVRFVNEKACKCLENMQILVIHLQKRKDENMKKKRKKKKKNVKIIENNKNIVAEI